MLTAPLEKEPPFVIGPNNPWAQAWQALLAGHRVRRPFWNHYLVIDRDSAIMIEVKGETKAEWLSNGLKRHEWMSVKAMLLNDWEVLPKIDSEPYTV